MAQDRSFSIAPPPHEETLCFLYPASLCWCLVGKGQAVMQYLRPKWHLIPYIVHTFDRSPMGIGQQQFSI